MQFKKKNYLIIKLNVFILSLRGLHAKQIFLCTAGYRTTCLGDTSLKSHILAGVLKSCAWLLWFAQNLAFLKSFTWFTVSLCRIRWAKALTVVLEWEDRLRLKSRIIRLSRENKTGKYWQNPSKTCDQFHQPHTTDGHHQCCLVPRNRMSLLLWEQIVDMRGNAKRRAADQKKRKKKERKTRPIMRELCQCFRKQLAVVIRDIWIDSWPHFSSIFQLVIDS